MKVALVLLVGCKSTAAVIAPAPVGPAPTEIAPRSPGPWTAVVTLNPNVATPVLEGPFLVTTINPGSSMEMAIAPDRRCTASGLAWFSYSGGGVAVGGGQTLCVRSGASEPRINGFSGYDPSMAQPAPP